jgi:hypothetical protein
VIGRAAVAAGSGSGLMAGRCRSSAVRGAPSGGLSLQVSS